MKLSERLDWAFKASGAPMDKERADMARELETENAKLRAQNKLLRAQSLGDAETIRMEAALEINKLRAALVDVQRDADATVGHKHNSLNETWSDGACCQALSTLRILKKHGVEV